MTGLTKLGVENLLNVIEKHLIVLPTEPMTTAEFEAWIRGYSECERRILQIVSELTEEQM